MPWIKAYLYVYYKGIYDEFRLTNMVLNSFEYADNIIVMDLRKEKPKPKDLKHALGPWVATVEI